MYSINSPLESICLKEAAEFLGFKCTHHLREKAATGKIPGAFKISNRWMFLKEELINLARDYSKNLSCAKEHASNRGDAWHLAKQKTVHTTTLASRFAESECRNRREQLREQKRNDMRKSEDVR